MSAKSAAGMALALALPVFLAAAVPTNPLKTPAEESAYSRYSQNEDIACFLSALESSSTRVVVAAVGKTLEVGDFPARDIFLVIITEEGAGSPEKLNRAKPTILVTASQHGDEQSAKEAALRLCRDLAEGELRSLLKNLNFLVIPQANPYGNWFDRRGNEQGLDLNRDHVKLESPEARAIHHVFRAWMPEVTVDLHERGDNYYRVSLGCVSNVNVGGPIQEFSRSVILADVEKSLEKSRTTFHEYLVTDDELGINTAAGADIRPEDLEGREKITRYSTTDLNDGRNSLGIYETLSFIQECASRYDLPTLAERTRWQYLGIRSFSEAVARHSPDVLSLVRGRRTSLLEEAGTGQRSAVVVLRMDYVRDEKQPTLTLRRFERTDSPVRGILKVDKKAGEPVLASELAPSPAPRQYKVMTEVVKNWFPGVAARLSVPRPSGYIIPAAHADAVACLLAHGVEVELLTRDISVNAETYLAREVVPSRYDYLPPLSLDVEKKVQAVLAKKGDFYVSCAQPAATLISCLLEPQSDYGLIRYRSFGLVPGAGDHFAFFRLAEPAKLPVIPYRPWGTVP
jgi:Zinc carboxypeptidase